MPFAEQYYRCMKLPQEGQIVEGKLLIQSIKVTQQNLLDGIYSFPIEIVVIGDSDKKKVSELFKPFFNKVVSLYTEYGSLYQCRGGKLEVETIAPKTFKVTTTGIGNRIYPKHELEAFIQFLKDYTGFHELNAEVIINTYLNYYKENLKC